MNNKTKNTTEKGVKKKNKMKKLIEQFHAK